MNLDQSANTMTIDVTSVNDDPTVSDVTNQSTDEDTALNGVAFTLTDVDHTVTCASDVVATSSNTTLLPNGNITIGG